MADTRRDFLLRFAAGALAAANGGRASFAEDMPNPHPDPRPMPVYGPPPMPPIHKCGDDPKDRCPPNGGKSDTDDGQKRGNTDPRTGTPEKGGR